MQRWTTSRKLWATLGLVWIGMLLLVGGTVLDKRNGLLQERRVSLEHFVDSARELVEGYVAQVQNGELSKADAEQRALERLQDLRFGKDGYLFVFDSDLAIVSHPVFETGQNMAGYQDENGVHIFREMKSIANNGEGSFVYAYRPSSSDPWQNKMSYVMQVPEWGWYLATGAYLTDVEAAFWKSIVELGGLLILVGLAVSLIMAWVIRDVMKSLGGDPRQAQMLVKRIAEGDLSQALALKRHDESSLLATIETMRRRLVSTLGQVNAASGNVRLGAGEIALANQDLSARTEQQAASLEETAASMEQMTQTVRQNADNAQQASLLVENVKRQTGEGGEKMKQVVGSMQTITEEAQRVTEVVGVIDSIAFQTNILALNASVEAARAGEQGRGFAVVASEVQTLAKRCADAAREIREMIESSHQRINDGSALIESTGESIRDIVDGVSKMSELVQEISSATQEQSAGIAQIGEAIGQMDQVTQQNASMVQEASNAAMAMESQATQMEALVGWFRLGEEAHRHGLHPESGRFGLPDAPSTTANRNRAVPEPA